jgi:hypothetical protein
MKPIDLFMAEFARSIRGNGPRAKRLLDEIEDHLRERAAQLSEKGLEPDDAELAAVNRFGSISCILRQFEREVPLESEVSPMLRYCITPVAILTAAYATLHLVFLWIDDAPWGWTLVKLVVATSVLAYNVALLYELQQKAMGFIERWFVFSGALVLVAIGAASTVWTIHLGQISGDWESYGFLGGGLMVLQGIFVAGYVAMPALVGETHATLPH